MPNYGTCSTKAKKGTKRARTKKLFNLPKDAGLEVLDQPATPLHILLFIKPAKQCFFLTQPASFSQVSDQRSGPSCVQSATASIL